MDIGLVLNNIIIERCRRTIYIYNFLYYHGLVVALKFTTGIMEYIENIIMKEDNFAQYSVLLILP